MSMHWPKLSSDQIKFRVFEALKKNINYREAPVFGLPGTYLDAEVFDNREVFLENAPFLSTFIANPNHIGVHTFGETDPIFKGTQKIEADLIRICAEEILCGSHNEQDGYVASGGTEANIEAFWIYRNYFLRSYGCHLNQIALLYSEDSHYSIAKAANLLQVQSIVIAVHQETREIHWHDFEKKIQMALAMGIKYFIVNVNLSTTMFGSVDPIDLMTTYLNQNDLIYKLHVDAAFGGFIFPFVSPDSSYSFKNPNITSFSLDAHKMLQTPYGTGIFLIRKEFMQYVCTHEATYVPGKDYTLCGSRSGANAIAIWMVLHKYGSEGWKLKMQALADLTSNFCSQLDQMGIDYFRNPGLNIVAIKAGFISAQLAKKYHLVPNEHSENIQWFKLVMMPHISLDNLSIFLAEWESERQVKC